MVTQDICIRNRVYGWLTPLQSASIVILLLVPWIHGCDSEPAGPQGVRESLLITVSIPDSSKYHWWFTYSLTFEKDDFRDSFTQIYKSIFEGNKTLTIPAPDEDAQATLVITPSKTAVVSVYLVKGDEEMVDLEPEGDYERSVVYRLNRWVTSSRKPPLLRSNSIRARVDGSPEPSCFDYWKIQLRSGSSYATLGDFTMSYAMEVNLRRPLTERTVLAEIQDMSSATLLHPSGTTVALSVDREALPANLRPPSGCLQETSFSTRQDP